MKPFQKTHYLKQAYPPFDQHIKHTVKHSSTKDMSEKGHSRETAAAVKIIFANLTLVV